MKLVDKMEMVNQEGIVLALIKIKHYDVILYGAGESGYSALRRLKELYDIHPLCIVDKDRDKSGTKMCGVKVLHPAELPRYIKNASDTYALIAVKDYHGKENIRSEIDSVLEQAGIRRKQYMSWRYNDARKSFDDYLRSHGEDIKWLSGVLEDEESRMALKEWVRCWLQADLYLLPEHPFRFKYCGCDLEGNDDLYSHLDDEAFVNCGSSIGDTIFQYLSNGYSFDTIHAYEGDPETFQKLQRNISLLDQGLQKKIILHQEYVGRKKDEVDIQLAGKRVTLINADIEGAELDVLKGMQNIVKEQKPVIAFCVYHKPEDMVSIPRFILGLDSSYHIYLRKYVHYDRNRWEMVMYAVPPERCLKKEAAPSSPVSLRGAAE